MRLTALSLHHYGNYQADRIGFSARPGVVNILYAPNSAGKSVLRHAVTDLLFGIGNQTPMGFRFGYPGMRMAASILRADGTEISFNRRKARGNALTNDDGDAIDAAFLHGILGGRDRGLLERLFVLDTDALRAGGKALLDSDGDVASALLSAAGGIRQARDLKVRLEKKRDDLAPTRKTASRPFYQALDRFNAARTRSRAALTRPDEWFRQQKDLDALEAQRRDHNAEADQLSATIARLERIRRARPWLARLADASAWLDAHPDAPRFVPGLRQDLDSARQSLALAEQAAHAALEKVARSEQDLAAVVPDDVLFALAARIDALLRDAGTAMNARNDLPVRRAELAQTRDHIADLTRQLGSDQSPEHIAANLPARPLIAKTQTLRDEFGRLATEERNAAAEIVRRTNDLTEHDAALAALPERQDRAALERLLTEIRASGDPAAAGDGADQALAEANAALSAAMARVPGWTGDAASLIAQRPPAIDLFRALDSDAGLARREMDTARERLDQDTATLEKRRRAVADLAAGGEPPDDAALAAARRHRDAGWRLIYRRAFAGETPSAAEEASFAGETPLPLAFERALTAADAIADRRVSESDLLATIESARRAVAEAEQNVEAASARVRLATERLLQTRRAWAQACAPLGLREDATLSEAQTFLERRDRVIEAQASLTAATSAHAALKARQAGWVLRLRDVLGEETGGLPSLLVLAEESIAAARRLSAARDEVERDRPRAARELLAAQTAHAAAKAGLTDWRARWHVVLAELGRPLTEEPAETGAVLQILAEIAKDWPKVESDTQRIARMTAYIGEFENAAREIAAGLPFLTLPADPFEAAPVLERLLTEERRTRDRHRDRTETLLKAQADAAAASDAARTARARVDAILALVGADTIEAAVPRLALSDQRAHFDAEKARAEAELHAAGDGFSIDALRAEANATPADEDVPRIDAARAAQMKASTAAQHAAAEASTLRLTLAGKIDNTAMADAAADQQAAIASLSGTLEEALVYHTAALLLGRALESVEKSGDSVLLNRFSTIFSALTRGAHERVVTEQDDSGIARLRLIQARHPEERQTIDQLSEGTRDQLFLALRVAAIEKHLTTAEPLPFIGDDILQTFDDDRALAALRVLAELSQRTQVIVLTHHRHVVDLAMTLGEDTVYPCPREALVSPA